ncbi:IS1-like element transposase [Serratia marcescens]|uniref:IS1-like element transposase n=1 Tax=Serratia marcescens TaxID=615 RepID=UPI003C70051D
MRCRRIFQLNYSDEAWKPGIKEHIVDMVFNYAGVRYTAKTSDQQNLYSASQYPD